MVILIAFVVSQPFLWSILWHYHLRILHHAPNEWTWQPLQLPEVATLFRTVPLKPLAPLVLLGLADLMTRRSRRLPKHILLAWTALCTVFLGWAFIQQAFDRIHVNMPTGPIPSFHWLFYLKASLCVLWGHGLVRACWLFGRMATRVMARLKPDKWVRRDRSERIGASAFIVSFVLVLMLTVPSFRDRDEFTRYRWAALNTAAEWEIPSSIDWVRENTAPEDRFVTSHRNAGVFVLGPAGRKVVAVNRYFSNPYVDRSQRVSDQDTILQGILLQNDDKIRPLARRYGVTHALLSVDQADLFTKVLECTALSRHIVFQSEKSIVLRLLPVNGRDSTDAILEKRP